MKHMNNWLQFFAEGTAETNGAAGENAYPSMLASALYTILIWENARNCWLLADKNMIKNLCLQDIGFLSDFSIKFSCQNSKNLELFSSKSFLFSVQFCHFPLIDFVIQRRFLRQNLSFARSF